MHLINLAHYQSHQGANILTFYTVFPLPVSFWYFIVVAADNGLLYRITVNH